MSKAPANIIRKTFSLKKEYSIGFYLTDFLFRKILRQNSGVKWPVHHSATVNCPQNIVRGKNVFPGDSPGVFIDAINGIEIGDYTNIGPNVGIISANHDYIDNSILSPSKPIVIGKHCWLGMGAIILPGIQLGDFTIVGAGAVVTRSFTDGYCILGGSPARIIRVLDRAGAMDFVKTLADK